MPIAKIINEVDAYLSRLRQARELLLDGTTATPETTVPRPPKKLLAPLPMPASPIRRRLGENKSQSNDSAEHLKKISTRVDTGVRVPSAVPANRSHSEQAIIAQPEPKVPESVPVTRLPARRRSSSTRSIHHRTVKPSAGEKAIAVKPAIALAGAKNARIVVVSPEQAQREREEASRPAAPRPRPYPTGLSGKSAFEALFNDGPRTDKLVRG